MSHSAGNSKILSRRFTLIAALSLASSALAISGCSDELEVPNQDARIVLVGDLSQAGDACGFETKATAQALEGDAGVIDAGGFDAGVEDVGVADIEEPNTDAGDVADADIEEPITDAGGPPIDAGEVDAGVIEEDTSSEDPIDAGTGEVDAGDEDEDASTDDPQPSGRAELAREGDTLAIPYLIVDREADAQSIHVEVCLWDAEADTATECGVAIAGSGGVGASGISTTPAGQCVLQLFNWDVGCGRFTGVDAEGISLARAQVDVEDDIIVRISVVDSKESPGQSAPFTLKALGFDALPHCE